jgi:hypothetical protein
MFLPIPETAWTMVIDFEVPVQFWGEAVITAVNIHQRS